MSFTDKKKTKIALQKQLKNLEEIRKKEREQYYKLFILPLDLEIKRLREAQKGKLPLHIVRFHSLNCSQRLREAGEVFSK